MKYEIEQKADVTGWHPFMLWDLLSKGYTLRPEGDRIFVIWWIAI